MIRYVIDTHKRCLNSLGEPQMPEVIDPNESESRQSLYRDLLSHLNTTLWGSPSILPYSESGKHTLDFNPVEAFDKSKNPEGAIFAEPEINWIESQIRGYPKAIAKAIRKAMQNEFRMRGPSYKVEAKLGEAGLTNEEFTEAQVASRLLRGTWYRGQESYPQVLGKEKLID